MKKIVVIFTLLLLVTSCSHSPAQSASSQESPKEQGVPAPSQEAPPEQEATEPAGEDWPPDADNIVGALMVISKEINPTDPPDIERSFAYNGVEQINGKDTDVFTAYAVLPERNENLGIYAKVKGEEVYFYFDTAFNAYRRVIIGDKAIYLEGDAPDTAEAPSVAMTEQVYDGYFIIEVPAFKAEGENAALQELNDAITNFSALALEVYKNKDDVYWAELKAYPFTSDAYVQIVMTSIEYPIYGTDGEVASFNYEVNSGAVITLEDAVSAHGLDIPGLMKELAESGLLSERQTVKELKISAFRILDDGNADFYISAFIDSSETEGWDSIFTYHTMDKSFDGYEHESLINPSQPDKMEPPLYYERSAAAGEGQ